MIENDNAYVRAILDAQPAITVLNNGIEMVDANDALFRFFPEYQNFARFKEAHACICSLFESYQDPLGHAYFEPDQSNWVVLAQDKDYRAVMRKNGENHYFTVR